MAWHYILAGAILVHTAALAFQNRLFRVRPYHTGAAWDVWHILNRVVLTLVPVVAGIYMTTKGEWPWTGWILLPAAGIVIWQWIMPWTSIWIAGAATTIRLVGLIFRKEQKDDDEGTDP